MKFYKFKDYCLLPNLNNWHQTAHLFSTIKLVSEHFKTIHQYYQITANISYLKKKKVVNTIQLLYYVI